MDIESYLLGKKASGGGGDTHDWESIGINSSDVPNYEDIAYNYAKEIYDNWDETQTDLTSKYENDYELMIFPTVDTSSVTKMYNMFKYCYKLTTIENINTENTTDMQYMFYNCVSLEKAPSINFSKMKSAGYAFYGCSKIKSFGDITYSSNQNISNTTNMFEKCSSLETIGKITLPTSGLNRPNLGSWFKDCIKLKKAPIVVNSERVQGYSSMFNGCTLLEDVPLYDMSGLQTNLTNYVLNCPNLTNESLNNILGSLLTITKETQTKTLQYIGLSSEQATTCQTLSNWSALSSAGWTTGY